MNKLIIFCGMLLIAPAAIAETVLDVTKQVVNRTPYKIEVCTDREVPGDKTKDTLAGAIVGGVIGNNITKNVENGAAVGALIGGIIGNQNSDATGGTRRVCQTETRYNEQIVNEYSHSEVTFTYESKTYTVKFQKQRVSSPLLVKIRLFLPGVGFGNIKEKIQ